MEIELLMWRRLVGHAEIDQVLWTAVLGKISGVFDVGIQGLQKLTVDIETRLAGEISSTRFCWPHEGEHSSRRPVLGERAGPWQLYGRIITVTLRSGWRPWAGLRPSITETSTPPRVGPSCFLKPTVKSPNPFANPDEVSSL